MKQGEEYFYGDVKSFSPKPLLIFPKVETNDVTEVAQNSAMLNATIIDKGTPEYDEKGFVYSDQTTTPAIGNGTSIKVSGSGEGAFQFKLTNLTRDKNYYVRAYVKQGDNYYYGKTKTFTPFAYVIISNLGIMVQKTDIGRGSMGDMKTLSNQCRVGGYDDWRIPTIVELRAIYDKRKQIGGFEEAKYWSSSPASSSTYYCINFADGSEDDSYSWNIRYVRLVRTIK